MSSDSNGGSIPDRLREIARHLSLDGEYPATVRELLAIADEVELDGIQRVGLEILVREYEKRVTVPAEPDPRRGVPPFDA